MRRKLRKDKDLIKELYSIVNKYLPNLLTMFDKLTDTRNQSYITYKMKTICITRLFSLLCGLTTMTDISSNNFNTDELRKIQKYIVKTLIRSKMFDRYKYNGYFQLIFDGTGLSNHNYNLNNNCLKRKHKDGKISYYKYVLECKLIVGNIVISLDSEFIENKKMITEKQKQDCETNAFKRMIKRIKKNYPKQKFIITGDGLYATSPIMKLCNKYEWKFIFNLKPERLKEVNSSFEGNIKLCNEVNIKNYYLSTSIEYKKVILNVFKFIETKKNKETTFRYVSNIQVNDDNIDKVVKLGRQRWKIENEGFYTQKHKTFDITHLNSRNDNSMKCHYYFIQFAHTIRQLLELGNILTKSLKLKIKEVSANLLKSLTSIISDLNDLQTNFQLRFDD